MDQQRERLGSRLGFILLSAGCAIGCGNVWKFPWMCGQYGGGAFVLLYRFFLVILGLPVMTMELSIGRAAQKIVVEVRRQFKVIKGLIDGKAEADYETCVDICTKSSLKEMIFPAALGILAPIIVGLVLGCNGVVGMLAGALISGFALAVMMANSGGAWDNAKKYIEAGNFGGKGSENHKAAVVGDTVGDPFKDTSGPSVNILIKLLSMVSIVFAALIATYGGMGLF